MKTLFCLLFLLILCSLGCPSDNETVGQYLPPLARNVISGDKNVCYVANNKLSCFSEPTYDEGFFKRNWSDVAKIPFRVLALTDGEYDGPRWQSACGITGKDKLICFKWVTGDVKDLENAKPATEFVDTLYVKSNTGCTRRKDGILQCFAPPAKGLYDSTNPPGPFVEIGLSKWSICGLKQNEETECIRVEGAGGTPEAELAPRIDDPTTHFAGDTFTSLVVDYTSLMSELASKYCAMDANHKARCWRVNNIAVVPSPPDDTKWVEMAVGAHSVCGVDDQKKLWCWSLDKNSTYTAAQKASLVGISVGPTHACAIKTDGENLCWEHPSTGYKKGVPNEFVDSP